MIVAIADDFSGAAEVAGVAHRHGLRAEVHLEAIAPTDAAFVACDAASRSCDAAMAAERTASAARTAMAIHPDWMFAKVDSLLRGPVEAQLTALLAALNLRRALIVPANPLLRRVVRGGMYFVDGRPLDQTDLANDPEHPIRSARVADMLGGSGACITIASHDAPSASGIGIIVGEAGSADDLAAWARRIESGTLPAGSAAFLGALLDARVPPPSGNNTRSQDREPLAPGVALIVSGTAVRGARERLRALRARGIPIVSMPDAVFGMSGTGAVQDGAIDAWTNDIVKALAGGRAIVAIDRPLDKARGRPRAAGRQEPLELTARLATVIERVLARTDVELIAVEGGATASSLVRRLGWGVTSVLAELAPGVVLIQRKDGKGPQLVVKPGSYPWPAVLTDALTTAS